MYDSGMMGGMMGGMMWFGGLLGLLVLAVLILVGAAAIKYLFFLGSRRRDEPPSGRLDRERG